MCQQRLNDLAIADRHEHHKSPAHRQVDGLPITPIIGSPAEEILVRHALIYLVKPGIKGSKNRIALPAAEQLLDVIALQLDVGRPAVAALSRVGRRFHLAQQRVHLLDVEAAAGPHAAVARHRGT